MTLRAALSTDRASVVRMLRDAHAAGDLPFPFSAPHAAMLFDAQCAAADRLCMVLLAGEAPHGVLMASVQVHPFAPVRYAAEVVWWIDPDHRGRGASDMLAAYEFWAEAQGAAFASMAALAASPRASIIYRRRGYVAAETHFLKPLG